MGRSSGRRRPGFCHASGGPISCEGPVPVDVGGASGGTRLRARQTVGNRAKSVERRERDGDYPGETDTPVYDGGSGGWGSQNEVRNRCPGSWKWRPLGICPVGVGIRPRGVAQNSLDVL